MPTQSKVYSKRNQRRARRRQERHIDQQVTEINSPNQENLRIEEEQQTQQRQQVDNLIDSHSNREEEIENSKIVKYINSLFRQEQPEQQQQNADISFSNDSSPRVKLNSQLQQFLEDIKEPLQHGALDGDIDLSIIFSMLFCSENIKKLEMKLMFESKEDYFNHVIPLFLNEVRATVKNQAKTDTNLIPIIYNLFPQTTEKGSKFLAYTSKEISPEQQNAFSYWQCDYLADYLEYLTASLFIVKIYVEQNDYILGIMKSMKGKNLEQKILIVPKNWRTRQFLKYNITYRILPLQPPHSFINQMIALLNMPYSDLFEGVLKLKKNQDLADKIEFQNQVQVSLKNFFTNDKILKIFSEKQQLSIVNSCNFREPFTLVNGPAGTGKTYTSYGIISLINETLKKSGQKGVILACARTNSVVDNWLRQISGLSEKNRNEEKIFNEIVNSEGEKVKLNVLRLGVPDNLEKDLLQFSIQAQIQNKLFNKFMDRENSQFRIIMGLKQEDFVTLKAIKEKLKTVNANFIAQFRERKNAESKSTFRYNFFVQSMNDNDSHLRILKKYYLVLDNLIKENKITEDRIQKYIIQQDECTIDVLIGTINSLGSSMSSKIKNILNENEIPIRICIIDEASQCQETDISIPISQFDPQKLILLGDEKQLQPMFMDKRTALKYKYDVSFFERLLDNGHRENQLLKNFRQSQPLGQLNSKVFYSDKVQLQEKPFPYYFPKNITKNNNLLFFDDLIGRRDKKSNDGSYSHFSEALMVIKLLIHLTFYFCHDPKQKVIAVLTPYKAQVKIIKENLPKFLPPKDCELIEVSTIDSFQGKESDIVIISTVRRGRNIGFLGEPERANVATSRAKYALFIFGSLTTLEKDEVWMKIISDFRLRDAIIPYTHEDDEKGSNYFEEVFGHQVQA